MSASQAFSFEVGGDLLTGTILPVGIGGISIICRDMGNLTKECTSVSDWESTGDLHKWLEAEVFNEVDVINLYFAHSFLKDYPFHPLFGGSI